jgi:hypothetical protein
MMFVSFCVFFEIASAFLWLDVAVVFGVGITLLSTVGIAP